MKACTTTQGPNGNWRCLAAAIGDGRIHTAELREQDIKHGVEAMMSLLGASDPNVRIGVCRWFARNATVIVGAAEDHLVEQLRAALQDATIDWTANDYAYGGLQCQENDVRYVADDALAALRFLWAAAAADTKPLSGPIPRIIRGCRQ